MSGAVSLYNRLTTTDGGKVYDSAVVVLSGDFEQREFAGKNIHWVAGNAVTAFIERHVTPRRRSYDVDLLVERLPDDALAALPTSVGPPASAHTPVTPNSVEAAR